MRLPEVRHNVRLITEACKGDLDGLAREARALEERKKWIQQEDDRLRKRVEEEAQRRCFFLCFILVLRRIVCSYCAIATSSSGSR